MGYVEGYTSEIGYCPFCGENVYTISNGAYICENEECGKKFFVVEDDTE